MTDRPAPPGRRAGTALGTLAGLTATTVLLVVAGRTLPFPADLHPDRLAAWADEVGGPMAAFTLLRALAVALVGWCAIGWVLGVAARMVRHPGAAQLTDRLSLPVVRRLADAATGLAVVGATLSPVAVAAAPAPTIPEPSVVTMVDLGPSSAMSDLGPADGTPSSTSNSLSAGSTAPTATPGTPWRSPDPAATPVRGMTSFPVGTIAEPSSDDGGATWIIGAGDTLWHVAQQTLTAELSRVPSGSETMDRVDRLVAANLDRLAVPGDPGLVFPGQEFRIP